MADKILLNATKGKPKKLSLCNKNLNNVPKIIGIITSLKNVDLKSNNLTDLPKEMSTMSQVHVILDFAFMCLLLWWFIFEVS